MINVVGVNSQPLWSIPWLSIITHKALDIGSCLVEVWWLMHKCYTITTVDIPSLSTLDPHQCLMARDINTTIIDHYPLSRPIKIYQSSGSRPLIDHWSLPTIKMPYWSLSWRFIGHGSSDSLCPWWFWNSSSSRSRTSNEDDFTGRSGCAGLRVGSADLCGDLSIHV